jgi:hypothetical protein
MIWQHPQKDLAEKKLQNLKVKRRRKIIVLAATGLLIVHF